MHLLLVVTMVVLPVMIVRGLVIVGGVGPSSSRSGRRTRHRRGPPAGAGASHHQAHDRPLGPCWEVQPWSTPLLEDQPAVRLAVVVRTPETVPPRRAAPPLTCCSPVGMTGFEPATP